MLLTGALAEFEASAAVLSQAAAALQSRALVYVYSCNMGAAIQVQLCNSLILIDEFCGVSISAATTLWLLYA